MTKSRFKNATIAVTLVAVVTITAFLVLPGLKRRRAGYATFIPIAATAEAAVFSPWQQAVHKVKEDRGEPTGKQVKVDIPQQLRHYSDPRRFLAVQIAEWREHRFETPQDFVDLARLIGKGEMVELKPVSENYILYGVGGSTDTEPFTHYEKSTGQRITLYNEAELAEEYARIASSRTSLENEIATLKQELNSADKRERAKRAMLKAQVADKEKALKAEQERKQLLDDYYGNTERRQQLLDSYQTVERLTKNFSRQTYNINDAHSRREMKVRMLSFLRPEALKVLEEIASSYRQKFDRPLPITSLVRPDEYQYMLSKVNPNATRIETPPHSTGLAFDIYYRFMTAEEQSHVMADMARLEDEGRIEVLRENRDHYHVFAFVDGERPDEKLVRESLGKTSALKALKETEASEKVPAKDERKAGRKEVKKKEIKKKEAKKEGAKKERWAMGKRR